MVDAGEDEGVVVGGVEGQDLLQVPAPGTQHHPMGPERLKLSSFVKLLFYNCITG